jgi:hypothetical protein
LNGADADVAHERMMLFVDRSTPERCNHAHHFFYRSMPNSCTGHAATLIDGDLAK